MAVTQKNVQAAKAVIAEQNEMLGFHRDKAPNTEREQARLEAMTDEDIKLAKLAAKIRTTQESTERNKVQLKAG